MIHLVLINKPNGKIPRGRSRQRWLDRVNKGLKSLDKMTRIEASDDRKQWKALTRAAN